ALTGSSVHLAGWPEPSVTAPEPGLVPAMDGIRRLASLARAARETGKLKVRQPLGTMQVSVPAAVRGATFERLFPILQAEVNVKRIETAASDTDLVRLKAKANFRSLGKRYGKDTASVAKAVADLTGDELRTLEGGGEVSRVLNGVQVVYFSEDVVVEREVATSWLVASEGPFVAALDPSLTPELSAEGVARELVHHIQRLRREAGFAMADRIALGIEADEAVLAAVRAHQDFIATETLSRTLEAGQAVAGAEARQAVDLEGTTVTLTARRLAPGA
ncbi:MAG TPA: DUF5915 domain-containing protein, partial [Gemmatimonadales bacterium]|nr:DUF5915 domain-containing protein [Gemmatimonadales bacterium]